MCQAERSSREERCLTASAGPEYCDVADSREIDHQRILALEMWQVDESDHGAARSARSGGQRIERKQRRQRRKPRRRWELDPHVAEHVMGYRPQRGQVVVVVAIELAVARGGGRSACANRERRQLELTVLRLHAPPAHIRRLELVQLAVSCAGEASTAVALAARDSRRERAGDHVLAFSVVRDPERDAEVRVRPDRWRKRVAKRLRRQHHVDTQAAAALRDVDNAVHELRNLVAQLGELVDRDDQ